MYEHTLEFKQRNGDKTQTTTIRSENRQPFDEDISRARDQLSDRTNARTGDWIAQEAFTTYTEFDREDLVRSVRDLSWTQWTEDVRDDRDLFTRVSYPQHVPSTRVVNDLSEIRGDLYYMAENHSTVRIYAGWVTEINSR